MLSALLKIKRHREQRLQALLAHLSNEQKMLSLNHTQYQQQQAELYQQWRSLADHQGCLTQHDIARLRNRLDQVESNVKQLARQMEKITLQMVSLSQQKQQQEASLRTNLRCQEKLKLLDKK